MNTKPEFSVAAKWWADQLRRPADHDAGDRHLNNSIFLFGLMLKQNFTEDEISAFQSALERVLTEDFKDDDWHPDDPIRGGYLRCFGTDYGPGDILERAAESAGIKLTSLTFPIKTLMWVNPGSVKVKSGYRAESVEIFAVTP